MKNTLLGLGLLVTIFCSSISYGAVLNIQNGILFGATGVDVNGVLYDVSFQDGTCPELYNGCDQDSDFPFSNPQNDVTLGLAANLALLDQVLIDSPLGAFDSAPELTNGCFATDGCQLNTPLFLSQGGTGLGILWIFNRDDNDVDTGTGSGGGSVAFDTSIGFPDSNVYVIWSQSSAVPIPATIWLFGSGLLGLVGVARRKKA